MRRPPRTSQGMPLKVTRLAIWCSGRSAAACAGRLGLLALAGEQPLYVLHPGDYQGFRVHAFQLSKAEPPHPVPVPVLSSILHTKAALFLGGITHRFFRCGLSSFFECPTYGLIGDRLYMSQLDHPTCQKPQAPAIPSPLFPTSGRTRL